MKREFLHPPGLSPARGYTHVVSVEDARKLIFVSGQVALDAEGKLVGPGDLAAQFKQALTNLATALRSAGASPADVVKLNIYVVNYKPADGRAFRDGYAAVFARPNLPATTMVGVTSLVAEGLMVEVEGIAAVG